MAIGYGNLRHTSQVGGDIAVGSEQAEKNGRVRGGQRRRRHDACRRLLLSYHSIEFAMLTVPGHVDENIRLRTHPTTFRGFSENSTGLVELPLMDVVTPACPLDKGDIVTKVYARAPEDNINVTESGEDQETPRDSEGAPADPNVSGPNAYGVCPSEQKPVHKCSTACEVSAFPTT